MNQQLTERAPSVRLIVVAVSVAVLAGCGAKPTQSHGASTWAESYCSALNSWVTTVEAVSRGFVVAPESATQQIFSLETAVSQVAQASNTLTDALSRAGRPETPGAAQVEATIAKLSHSVRARRSAATRAAKSNDRSALAGLRRLHAVTGQIDGALTDIVLADASVRRTNATLARALDSSSACKDFHSNVKNGTDSGNR